MTMRFNNGRGGVTCDNLINGKRCNNLYMSSIPTPELWEELEKDRHICPECEIELAVAGEMVRVDA